MKQDFKTLWKNLAANKQNTARHSIQYCILKAMACEAEDKVAVATHFLRKALTPVTSQIKLANGRRPFDILVRYDASICSIWSKKVHPQILGVEIDDLLDEDEKELFTQIALAISPTKLVRNYTYFFTRQDIFDEYQLVQTAHAALELGAGLTPEEAKGLYFTCCGVENLDALENVENVLQSMKLPYVAFREPDIGNQKTAIGVFPVPEHRRGLLRNYNLLRFNRGSGPVGAEVW